MAKTNPTTLSCSHHVGFEMRLGSNEQCTWCILKMKCAFVSAYHSENYSKIDVDHHCIFNITEVLNSDHCHLGNFDEGQNTTERRL